MSARDSKSKIDKSAYSLANAKDFTKELVAATPSQRNWKGILIALIVICAVLGLILFSIYLLQPPDEGPRVKGRKVTLDDVKSSKFVVQPFNGTWVSDKELLFRDYLGGLSLLNVETLESRPFIANTTFRQLNAHKYFVSPNLHFILFVHETQSFWQHSFVAKYTIYDIENEFQTVLSPSEDLSRDQDQPYLQWAGWVPRTNSLIFIYKNDIYYKPDPTSSTTFRITNTGISGVIYNGIPDWLYETEIFKSNSAVWVSPQGQYLVYASFNDSQVGEASYHWYGDNLPYPKLRTLRYPKAGTQNPTVTLSAVNLKSNTLDSIVFKPPDAFRQIEHYVTGVNWVTNDTVTVVWMSRRQNTSIITNCRGPGWICREIYTVKNTDAGWLDFVDAPVFSKDGRSCLLRIPWRDGEAGYFRHIVWLDVRSGKGIPITQGPFEVTQIVAWDQSNQLIFFIAAPQGSVGQRQLYRAAEKSSNSTVIVAPICLTCPKNNTSTNKSKKDKELLSDLLVEVSDNSSQSSSPDEELSTGTESMIVNVTVSSVVNGSLKVSRKRMLYKLAPCLYNRVSFSPNKKYFIRECQGPGVPTVTLHNAPMGRLLFVLDNNTALKQEVADMGLPVVRTFFVEVSGGYKAPVKLYLPPGLREQEEFKFPLVLHVNGEPGSQLVSERWGLSWNTYLVSQKNYIVAEIDGRGTGFQGESNRHSIYGLGELLAIDQIDAVRDLASRLHFIDRDNMAVWGWGYGGYVSALVLAHDDSKLFRCGISVAPISKWEFHNSAFTERYMGLPNFTENYIEYGNADIAKHTANLLGKKILIIHGTADDTVQFQHTLYFTKALVKDNVSFTQQVYPDEDHRINGVKEHLYMTMEAFLEGVFDVIDWEDYEKANFLGIRM